MWIAKMCSLDLTQLCRTSSFSELRSWLNGYLHRYLYNPNIASPPHWLLIEHVSYHLLSTQCLFISMNNLPVTFVCLTVTQNPPGHDCVQCVFSVKYLLSEPCSEHVLLHPPSCTIPCTCTTPEVSWAQASHTASSTEA